MRKLACLLVLLFCAGAVSALDLPSKPFIKVQGEAELKKQPDLATLSFAIQYEDDDYQDGYQTLQGETQKLLAFCAQQKIPREQIETYKIDVFKERNYKTRAVRSFKFKRSFQIQLTDLSRINQILDGLYHFQINGSINSSFDVTDRKAIEKKLLKQAIQNSKEKAIELTRLYGASIKGVYAISESQFGGIGRTFLPAQASYRELANGRQVSYAKGNEPFLIPREITLWNRIHVIFYLGN